MPPSMANQRTIGREGIGHESAWVGWIGFAGAMMVLLGIYHVIQGLVALFNDDYYLVRKSGLVLNVSYTTWGWMHLIGGLVVIAAGVGVMRGQVWARAVGVVLAMLSAIANIGFMGAYPVWSMLMVAMDITVILALTVHGAEMRDVPEP
jgi:hypothetical protein